jgi:hypothetical protein
MGPYANSKEWRSLRKRLHMAIRAVDHPPGTGKFTIYPESGKGRGQGNGVTPIKLSLMKDLAAQGWKLEEPLDIATLSRPGSLDAVLYTPYGPIAVEWETGEHFVQSSCPEQDGAWTVEESSGYRLPHRAVT